MTRVLDWEGASTEDMAGRPFVLNRIVQLLDVPTTPAASRRMMAEAQSGTDRSYLADMVLHSPQASGVVTFYQSSVPTLLARTEQPQNVVPLSRLRPQVSRRSFSLLHELGHWILTSGPVYGVAESLGEVAELYAQALRNSRAHTFYDPLDEEQSEEAVRSSVFLTGLYRAREDGQENLAMRMIYGTFYRLRMNGDFGLCGRILDDSDENRLTPALLAAILTITAPLKKSLPRQRTSFFRRAKEAITRVRGPEAAERILIGLE